MKIVIQDAHNKTFVIRNGWAKDVEMAECFLSTSDAVTFARNKRLKDVEIVHIFDDPQCVLPQAAAR